MTVKWKTKNNILIVQNLNMARRSGDVEKYYKKKKKKRGDINSLKKPTFWSSIIKEDHW